MVNSSTNHTTCTCVVYACTGTWYMYIQCTCTCTVVTVHVRVDSNVTCILYAHVLLYTENLFSLQHNLMITPVHVCTLYMYMTTCTCVL